MMIDFDCSSKLCFEVKSNSVICDKMFKKGQQLIYLGAVMVSVAKVLYHAIPAKSVKNFII